MLKPVLACCALAAPAVAEPCATDAPALVDVEQRHSVARDSVAWAFHVTTSGAWSFLYRDATHKLVEVEHGCLDAPVLAALRDKLAKATWSTKRRARTCTEPHPGNDRSYHVRGKQVWVARGCNIDQLDAASANALDDVDTLWAPQLSAHESD